MVLEYQTCTICHGTGQTPDYSRAKDSRGNYITPPQTTCIGCGGAGRQRNPNYERELERERQLRREQQVEAERRKEKERQKRIQKQRRDESKRKNKNKVNKQKKESSNFWIYFIGLIFIIGLLSRNEKQDIDNVPEKIGNNSNTKDYSDNKNDLSGRILSFNSIQEVYKYKGYSDWTGYSDKTEAVTSLSFYYERKECSWTYYHICFMSGNMKLVQDAIIVYWSTPFCKYEIGFNEAINKDNAPEYDEIFAIIRLTGKKTLSVHYQYPEWIQEFNENLYKGEGGQFFLRTYHWNPDM